MNRMIAITISPDAVTAEARSIVSGNAWPIMPPPAATSTRKNVPNSSENRRRHSWRGSWKSSIGSITSASNHSSNRARAPLAPSVCSFTVAPSRARDDPHAAGPADAEASETTASRDVRHKRLDWDRCSSVITSTPHCDPDPHPTLRDTVPPDITQIG